MLRPGWRRKLSFDHERRTELRDERRCDLRGMSDYTERRFDLRRVSAHNERRSELSRLSAHTERRSELKRLSAYTERHSDLRRVSAHTERRFDLRRRLLGSSLEWKRRGYEQRRCGASLRRTRHYNCTCDTRCSLQILWSLLNKRRKRRRQRERQRQESERLKKEPRLWALCRICRQRRQRVLE